MKKRYVKRLARKIILFTLTIVIISLITATIVENRIKKDRVNTAITDDNGDPVTPALKNLNKVNTPRRPRPPTQQRNFPVEIELQQDELGETTHLLNGGDVPHFQMPAPRGELKDWHDYAAMALDSNRTGLGEHGTPSQIGDETQKELEQKMSMENGFNALLSDAISVNRSLPDVRMEGCRHKKYLAKLPTVSIVLPFFNEHFSVLLRSVYSIINRTPAELLEQIILVDDYSDRESVKAQLDDYIATHFPQLVQVVRLSERTGLIGARLAGARKATAAVLVFFDSHIECNYNWLPPLLEPIAINAKISTCPIVDIIDHATFAYTGGYQEGSRGAFDWEFLYKQLPLLPEIRTDKTKPYESPIMMGGLFAIGREFFWELGGYDDGLDIWGAEQYELSFKIWMCGGMLLDIPCSRVAHIFRGPMTQRESPRKHDFVSKNHKRVAEVWMDEYKEYIYKRNPEAYENLDAGDLTAQKAVRERLKCKSFKWFLEVVAPDILEAYPPIPPPDYASGAVQSVAYPKYCLDTLNGGNGGNSAVGLYECAENKTHPQGNQFWALSWYRDLRAKSTCLDVQDSYANSTVWMWSCHSQGGNQFWYYDRENQWLVHAINGDRCMEAFVEEGKMAVYTNGCDKANVRMKWKFGFVNNTALDEFYKGLE